MLAIVKKTKCNISKELTIFSAVGVISTVEGVEKEYLEEKAEIGKIFLSECRSMKPVEGFISNEHSSNKVAFEYVKPPKWNGRVGKIKCGTFYDVGGEEQYSLMEVLREQDTFWIFKSGYMYYELKNKANGKKFNVKDICFASDMHFYYIFDDSNELVTAIYKPHRLQGEDEYHIYAKENCELKWILFVIAYVDYFMYQYDGTIHDRNNLEFFSDDAAYNISDDELLALYDEKFTKDVIKNAN